MHLLKLLLTLLTFLADLVFKLSNALDSGIRKVTEKLKASVLKRIRKLNGKITQSSLTEQDTHIELHKRYKAERDANAERHTKHRQALRKEQSSLRSLHTSL